MIFKGNMSAHDVRAGQPVFTRLVRGRKNAKGPRLTIADFEAGGEHDHVGAEFAPAACIDFISFSTHDDIVCDQLDVGLVERTDVAHVVHAALFRDSVAQNRVRGGLLSRGGADKNAS